MGDMLNDLLLSQLFWLRGGFFVAIFYWKMGKLWFLCFSNMCSAETRCVDAKNIQQQSHTTTFILRDWQPVGQYVEMCKALMWGDEQFGNQMKPTDLH